MMRLIPPRLSLLRLCFRIPLHRKANLVETQNYDGSILCLESRHITKQAMFSTALSISVSERY